MVMFSSRWAMYTRPESTVTAPSEALTPTILRSGRARSMVSTSAGGHRRKIHDHGVQIAQIEQSVTRGLLAYIQAGIGLECGGQAGKKNRATVEQNVFHPLRVLFSLLGGMQQAYPHHSRKGGQNHWTLD